MILWFEFAICSLIIVHSGARLSKYGDILAEKTGLGGSLIGVFLVASVTSLPEMVTGISSVTFANAPDIAVGDVLGSCVFNLFILAALLDGLHQPLPISTSAHHGHILSASFGIVLLSITAFFILFPQYNVAVGWVGASSLAILAIYLVGLKIIISYEKRLTARFLKEVEKELHYHDVTLRKAIRGYALNAALVVGAAAFLPEIGARIAAATGLGQTFVGNILLAMTSSLPEVVVSIAAVRIGAVDLAIGNLFGSNLFNIFILVIDDLLFARGPLLSFIDPSHIISAGSAIAMTAVSIVGLTYQADHKRLPWGWDSIAMMVIFISNVGLLFLRI